jgi:hypothetical protein
MKKTRSKKSRDNFPLMIRPLDERFMDGKSHGIFIPTMRQYAEHVIPLCLTMLDNNMPQGFLSYNIGSKLSRR